MPRKRPSPPKVVAVTLGAVALLVLCLLAYATWRSAAAPSAADLARAAEEALAERDFRAAVIQYKAAVQAAPDDPELRLALGRLHLQLRQFADALNHLRLARPLGDAQPEIVLDLARVQVELGKFEDAGRTLADYRGEDAGTAAGLQARVRHALGQTAEAKALLEAQRAKTPQSMEINLTEARMALAQTDLRGALDALSRALEADPEHAEAQTLMGMVRLQEGDTSLAAAHFKAAAAQAANPLEALTGLAEAQLMQRQHQPARETIALIAEQAPKAPMLPYLRGWLAWSKGNWAHAEPELQRALKVMKTHPRLLLMLADSTLRQDKLNQAEEYLKTLEALAPGLPAGRQLLGRVQLKQKRALEAIATLTPLAAAKPVDVSTLVMLSQAHRLAGHKDKSQAYLQQAVNLTPDGPQSSLLSAVSDLEAGRLEQGIAGLQALREGELAVPSTRALVMAQTEQGEPELALESARALVELAPEDAASHHLLGSLLLRTGDEAAARKAFARALELTPDYAPTQTSLALLALAKNEPAAAETLLRKALAQDARYEPAAVALGVLLARSGRGAEADAVLDTAIAAQPQAGAPRWLRAERYLQQGDRDKGLALARKAFELAPDVPANQLRWGIFLLAAGSGVQAVEVLKALVDDDPEASLARAALARAAQATGQWPLARTQYEALLAQVPDHAP
ncbi:MAG: system TPR-repeat protein PrsT, partial [Pseudomonadota bacterium]